jgi:YD repeat-containing protein
MAQNSRFPSRSITQLIAITLLLALSVGLEAHVQAQTASDINYVYDELGRLVAVIDPTGDTAVYTYDAVGNLLSISRFSSSVVSILQFSPNQGPAGTLVRIHGTSFSTTPSQNAVTFNSVAATVTAATATEIVTSVPSGATSGLIAVTTPTGSATSSTPFTVSASTAPTITSFTPTIGTAGTAVTISGTNFDPIVANNIVTLNGGLALVDSLTSTNIATSVPVGATSGHIRVNTPDGAVVSSDDFFVPPSPYNAADVVFTDRMAFGQNKTVIVGTANKIGLVLFNGTAGERVSLQISNSTFPGCIATYDTIKNPDGTNLASTFLCSVTGYIDAVVLPQTGSYTILIDPEGTNTGSQTLLLNNVPPDVTGTITPGGAALTVTTTTPGQNASLTFSGSAGQRVSLQISNSTFPGCIAIYDTIKDPDGTAVASTFLCGTTGYIDTLVLPVTGNYKILVDPQGTITGSQTLLLNELPPDVAGTIAAGGPAVTVTTTVPGQNGQLSFSGSANQRVSLKVSGVSLTGGSYNWLNVSIKKPDGSALVSSTLAGNGFIDLQTLPVTGTYTILVDPWDMSTGNVTLTLYDVPADVSGTITPSGSAVTVTTTVPGQNGQLSFSGSANQRVSLQVSGVSLTGGSYNWLNVSIKKPDGSALVSSTLAGNGFFDTQALPVAGTYTILVDPWDMSTGSVTLTLYDVPADATSTAAVGGSAVTVTTTVPGQNAQLTFSGTAAQQINVTFTNNSMGTVTAKLLKPDGSELTSTISNSNGFSLAAQTLPTSGTYTVSLDPSGNAIGSLTVSITELAGNLAFNKTATQSSTNWSAPANRAVDGNTDGNFGDGSVTHTQVENQPWWQVDLGSVQSIGNIDIWNRTDCCGDALTNFYVFVSDDPFASTDLSTTQNQTGVSSYHVSGQGGTPTTLNANRTGRYVRVQLVGQDRLSLAEVQVWLAP